MRFFGFVARPFSRVDPLLAPYTGEPFSALRVNVRDIFAQGRASSVLLLGENGSGRSTLARQIATDYAPSGPVAFISGEENGRTLLQRVSIALGGGGATLTRSASGIELLLEQLAAEAAPPLLLLDSSAPAHGYLEEAALLLRAAAASRCFRVLLIGNPDLVQQLARTSQRGHDLASLQLSIPPLNARQTLDYMSAGVRAALGPNSNDVVITPDAAFLTAHRSAGRLRVINRITTSMLGFAAAEGRRVLTSWDAWNGHSDALGNGSSVVLPRPNPWPTPEVLQILNSSRQEFGIVLRRAADLAVGT